MSLCQDSSGWFFGIQGEACCPIEASGDPYDDQEGHIRRNNSHQDVDGKDRVSKDRKIEQHFPSSSFLVCWTVYTHLHHSSVEIRPQAPSRTKPKGRHSPAAKRFSFFLVIPWARRSDLASIFCILSIMAPSLNCTVGRLFLPVMTTNKLHARSGEGGNYWCRHDVTC